MTVGVVQNLFSRLVSSLEPNFSRLVCRTGMYSMCSQLLLFHCNRYCCATCDVNVICTRKCSTSHLQKEDYDMCIYSIRCISIRSSIHDRIHKYCPDHRLEYSQEYSPEHLQQYLQGYSCKYSHRYSEYPQGCSEELVTLLITRGLTRV